MFQGYIRLSCDAVTVRKVLSPDFRATITRLSRNSHCGPVKSMLLAIGFQGMISFSQSASKVWKLAYHIQSSAIWAMDRWLSKTAPLTAAKSASLSWQPQTFCVFQGNSPFEMGFFWAADQNTCRINSGDNTATSLHCSGKDSPDF